MYVHTGDRLSVETIRPSDTTLLADADDHQLHYRNMADVASTMMEIAEMFAELGLVAQPGEVM